MPTCSEMIASAYRIAHVRARAASIVEGEKDVGLERLQGMFVSMATEGMFGALVDKRLTSADDYEAKEFERVINTAAATITYPDTITDDFDGTERTPRDMCIISVVVPGADPAIKIYDAFMAEWIAIDTLAFASYCPLSFRYREHIKNLLAAYICDEAGLPISPLLAKKASTAKLTLSANHGAPRKPVQHEFF